MSYMGKVGDLSEIEGTIRLEWTIKNFSSLCSEKEYYESPSFYFAGTSWSLHIYPNGKTNENSDGWIGLYLIKESSGSPGTLCCSIGFKNSGFTEAPKEYRLFAGQYKLEITTFIKRSLFLKKKSFPFSSDSLTVTCFMKNEEPKDIVDSHFNQLLRVSDNLKEIYRKGKKADFTLKAKNGEKISAHRVILETRSRYFAPLDAQGSQTNEESIEDLDKSALDNILCYMYSGDINELTTANALSVYIAAEKFHIKHVKKVCLKFIIENLSVDWVCDIIKFADFHNEYELGRCAKEYFAKNADRILDSDSWKSFIKENSLMGVEILSSVVKSSQPKNP